jgi:hypothetical protein
MGNHGRGTISPVTRLLSVKEHLLSHMTSQSSLPPTHTLCFSESFSMQNAVRSSNECIPNTPSAMDYSTFVPSLSGLDVSSVGVPTFGHETCILKGGKYCDICKLIKTLIGHSMCRWQLQNKIYCKVTYLTLEFWCWVQGTYHAMIRTSPRSSSHPSGRCGRRSRRIGPCKVDTI